MTSVPPSPRLRRTGKYQVSSIKYQTFRANLAACYMLLATKKYLLFCGLATIFIGILAFLLSQVFSGRVVLPQFFQVGPLTIHYYGLILALAAASGFYFQGNNILSCFDHFGGFVDFLCFYLRPPGFDVHHAGGGQDCGRACLLGQIPDQSELYQLAPKK